MWVKCTCGYQKHYSNERFPVKKVNVITQSVNYICTKCTYEKPLHDKWGNCMDDIDDYYGRIPTFKRKKKKIDKLRVSILLPGIIKDGSF